MRTPYSLLLLLTFAIANAEEEELAVSSQLPEVPTVRCVSGFQELRSIDLEKLGMLKKRKDRWKVTIDESSPCATFSQSFISRVELLRLPEFSEPYEIAVNSMVGRHDRKSGESAMFSPAIMLLNESFEETRSYSSEKFRYRGGKLNHTIFVNSNNASERFLLVYTTPDDVGEVEDKVSGNINTTVLPIGATFIAISTGSDRRTRVVNAGTGSLQIMIVKRGE